MKHEIRNLLIPYGERRRGKIYNWESIQFFQNDKLAQWSDICEKNSDRRAKKRTQGRYALDNTHTSLMIDKWITRAIRQSQAR